MKIPALTLLLLLLVPTLVVAEESYFPLAVGNRWAYTSDLAGPEIRVITEGPDVLFPGAYQLEYDVSDNNLSLINIWSTNEDGDVFLHGFQRQNPQAAQFYDPPLQVVDAPLVRGKTWTSTCDVLGVVGGQPLDTITLLFSVVGEEIVEVAGDRLRTFGVTEEYAETRGAASKGIMRRLTLDGRLKSGEKDDPIVPNWWNRGVGKVLHRSAGVFRLVDYRLTSSVGNEDLDLSELKRRYR